MEITVVGGLTILMAAYSAVDRRALIYLLALVAGLPTTAAITSPSVNVAPFHLLCIPLFIRLAFQAYSKNESPEAWLFAEIRARLRLLHLFVAICITATVIGPILFEGTLVLDPTRGIDAQILSPTPLAYSAGNFSQVVYALLGLAAARYIMSVVESRASTALATGFLGVLLLSAAPLVMPDGIRETFLAQFQNFPGAGYNQFDERHSGVFSEPSYLATYCVAALAFGLASLLRGSLNISLSVGIIGLSVANLVPAQSATALAAGALATLAVVGVQMHTALVKRRLPAAFVIACLILSMAIALLARPAGEVLIAKLSSDSGTGRFAADRFSLGLAIETYGIGVGLGSNRSSSFLVTLISCGGIIATAILASLLLRIFRHALTHSAAAWALLVLLTAKCIAEPDLATPSFWLLLGASLVQVKPRLHRTAPPMPRVAIGP